MRARALPSSVSEYDLSLIHTDRGRRIALARDVDAPAAAVWEVLTDVNRWEDWGPPVTDVDYPDRTITAGTTGRVQAFGFLWVPFRVETCWNYAWTWSVWGLTPPADGHRVEDLGGGRSRVVLELPLWAPWYLLLCRVALRNVARTVDVPR